MERNRNRERGDNEPVPIEWEKLMEEALNMPGKLGNVYNRFYNYSFTNQLLLFMQGVQEPVATYKRWLEMGRQVQKGSKAKAILRPVAYKETNDQGVEESKVKGFKMVNCLFTASETEGKELPPYELPDWNPDLALRNLDITEVPFTSLNGNIQGMSYPGRRLSINPAAAYPLKTFTHEMAHIVLGHTEDDRNEEYLAHRGLFEFEAEATAYLTMNELEATEHMNKAESRNYIQTWLQGQTPDDASIKRVFSAVDKILKSGRTAPREVK